LAISIIENLTNIFQGGSMKKLLSVASYLVPAELALLFFVKDKAIFLIGSLFLVVFGIIIIFPRKRRAIRDVPLYGLYFRQNSALFFKITEKLHMHLEAGGFEDALLLKNQQELYRVGSSEKFNPDEIVVLKRRFKCCFHPDLHINGDYVSRLF
jgi:hypothetical protein